MISSFAVNDPSVMGSENTISNLKVSSLVPEVVPFSGSIRLTATEGIVRSIEYTSEVSAICKALPATSVIASFTINCMSPIPDEIP